MHPAQISDPILARRLIFALLPTWGCLMHSRTIHAAGVCAVCIGMSIACAARADSGPAAVDAAALARIRDAAMGDQWAFRRLEELTDRIGPRLSGSPQLTAALAQVADAMRLL